MVYIIIYVYIDKYGGVFHTHAQENKRSYYEIHITITLKELQADKDEVQN